MLTSICEFVFNAVREHDMYSTRRAVSPLDEPQVLRLSLFFLVMGSWKISRITSYSSLSGGQMVKKKIDSRIRDLIENGVQVGWMRYE